MTVCVCLSCTSCSRLLRSACVRVTATTFAPQRARARAVALPIPEKPTIQKHKDLLESVTPELTHTVHACLRLCHNVLHEQSFSYFTLFCSTHQFPFFLTTSLVLLLTYQVYLLPSVKVLSHPAQATEAESWQLDFIHSNILQCVDSVSEMQTSLCNSLCLYMFNTGRCCLSPCLTFTILAPAVNHILLIQTNQLCACLRSRTEMQNECSNPQTRVRPAGRGWREAAVFTFPSSRDQSSFSCEWNLHARCAEETWGSVGLHTHREKPPVMWLTSTIELISAATFTDRKLYKSQPFPASQQQLTNELFVSEHERTATHQQSSSVWRLQEALLLGSCLSSRSVLHFFLVCPWFQMISLRFPPFSKYSTIKMCFSFYIDKTHKYTRTNSK